MRRCFLIFFLALMGNVHALKIKLSNGQFYKGDVLAEDSSSYTIKMDNMPVTILKKMIVEIDGVPVNSSSSKPLLNRDTLDSAKTDYKGKMLSITLKNGMIFKGTMIRDNGKIIVLNRDGSPVNIYRSTIAQIDILDEQSERQSAEQLDTIQKNSATTSVTEPKQVKKQEIVTVTTFNTNSDSSVSRTNAIPTDKGQAADAGFQEQNQQSLSKKDKDVAEQAANVKNIDEAVKLELDSNQNAIKLKAISEVRNNKKLDSIYIPPVRTMVDDDKKRIMLKNGTVFHGKILSESDRFISFDSDGASMNILKKLIKEIDGVAYKEDFVSNKKNQSQKDPILQDSTLAFTCKRRLPSVEIPPGVTTETLLNSLNSSVWETRSKTCRILGAMGQWAYSAVYKLSALLADTAQMKSNIPAWIDSIDQQKLLAPSLEAARALAYLGDNGYQSLKKSLNSPDIQVRRSAVFGLLEFSGDREKVGVLLSILKDKEPSIRALALCAFCTPQDEDYLLVALTDYEAVVRSNASFLLGKLRNRKAIPQLQLLLNDNRSIVRANAIEALGLIGGIQVTDKILLLLNDPNFIVREKAVSAIGRLQDTIAIWPLINALRDVNSDVRASAATALSFIRDPRAIPSLYSLLKDENLIVRERARESLRLHTELHQLIAALTDANTTVRENAAYVLWLLTGKDYGNDKDKWMVWYTQEYKGQR